MLTLSFIVASLLVLGIVISNRKTKYPFFTFNSQTLLPLRGVLCIGIILHHASLSNTPFYVMYDLWNWGAEIVGIFFFMSGFGITKSYQKKGVTYLNGFLKKRFFKLLPTFALVLFLFLGYKSISNNSNEFYNSLLGLATGYVPTGSGWYVVAAIVTYVLWFLSFKISSCHIKNMFFLWGLTLLYWTAIKLSEWPTYWNVSIFCFPLGVSWATYEEQVLIFLRNKTNRYIFTIVLAAYLLGLSFFHNYFLYTVEIKICCISLATVLIVYSIGVWQNKILCFIGTMSYEIYLIQGIVTANFAKFDFYWIVYYILSIVVSVLAGYILNITMKKLGHRGIGTGT